MHYESTYSGSRRDKPDDEEGLEEVVSREPRYEHVSNKSNGIEEGKDNPVHHPLHLVLSDIIAGH